MCTCERRILSRNAAVDPTVITSLPLHVITRIAYAGLSSVLVLGCMGSDEPTEVTAAVQPSVLVAQTPLDGATVPKYVTPLTTLGGSRVDGTRTINVSMVEFQQRMLPNSMYANLPAPFNNGTFLWGYQVDGRAAHFPAATIEARQGTTTTVRYANNLQSASGGPPFLQKYLTQDLTVHWADPNHVTRNNNCANATVLSAACTQPSMSPII